MSELLRRSVDSTKELLRLELQIRRGELLEQLQSLRAMLVEMRDGIGEEEPIEENVAEATPVVVEEPVQKKKRAPRRKLQGEEGVVERPLFPFYEQTLF